MLWVIAIRKLNVSHLLRPFDKMIRLCQSTVLSTFSPTGREFVKKSPPRRGQSHFATRTAQNWDNLRRFFRKLRACGTPKHAGRRFFVTLLGLSLATAWACVAPARADDVVSLRAERADGGKTRWTGEILDYNAKELRLRLISGKERSFPAGEIAEITTPLSTQQQAGDERFAAHDYAGAFEQYRAALGAGERRDWVRRQIVARSIDCLRAQSQPETAGQTFVKVLLSGEGDTPYLDCIPLCWRTSIRPPALERAAASWLADASSPFVAILGASWLIGSAQNSAAVARLQRLSLDRDRRVAWLAQAQLWRTTLFSATEQDLVGYLRAIEDCPAELRAGPYFVLGSALAAKRPDEAALCLLRAPLVYPRDRPLGAAALLAAAEVFQRQQRDEDAARLYRELADDYPEQAEAKVANERLSAGVRKP